MADIVAATQRLRLRTWDLEDRAEFVRHCNTPAVTRFVGGVQDEADYTAAFERIERSQRESGHSFWVVERKSDGAFLGFCGLKRSNLAGTPVEKDIEIGWRLREDAWGQGYASEAAKAVLSWAWANLEADRIVSFTIPANVPSRRVMERIGMIRRPDLDFGHPAFPAGHPLSAHVAYAADRPDLKRR